MDKSPEHDSLEAIKSELETDAPLVLKTWTAQDFSNIYVRFYPLVLAHVKKILSNQAQAEEVTQDAFFYLITSLPEVDSELGVLRLLKWKSRMLALDVIRSESRFSQASIDEVGTKAADGEEPSEALIRADDAAIVTMALAKVPERQREALILSLYQEKSVSEVAEALDLKPNAAAQLIYRARQSLRIALIGEADTAGLTVPQILTIAARKAAAESGKIITAAGVSLAVLAVSIGFLPRPAFESPIALQVIPQPTPEVRAAPLEPRDTFASDTEPPAQFDPLPAADLANSDARIETRSIEDIQVTKANQQQGQSQSAQTQIGVSLANLQSGLATENLSVRQVLHPLGTPAGQIALGFEFQSGVTLFVNYGADQNLLASPYLVAEIEGVQLVGVPKLTSLEISSLSSELSEIKLSIQDFYGLTSGEPLSDSWINDSASQVKIITSLASSKVVGGSATLKG